MPPVDDATTDTTSGTESAVATETAQDTTTASDPTTEPATGSEQKDSPSAETKTAVKLPPSLKVPAKTGRFQQRMSELARDRDQARDEARQLREEVARIRSIPRSGESQATATKRAGEAQAKLNPEDFETYGDYVRALVEQVQSERESVRQAEQSKTSYDSYRAEKQSEFDRNCAPLAEQYGEGFWDAITDPNLPVSEPVADAVMELGEMAPYVMLWLAANPTKALELAKQSPRAATIGVGRLAARLQAELGQTGTTATGAETSTAKPMTKPTPVPSIRGSSPANSLDGQPSDKDDIQSWLAKETARMKTKYPHGRFYGG